MSSKLYLVMRRREMSVVSISINQSGARKTVPSLAESDLDPIQQSVSLNTDSIGTRYDSARPFCCLLQCRQARIRNRETNDKQMKTNFVNAPCSCGHLHKFALNPNAHTSQNQGNPGYSLFLSRRLIYSIFSLHHNGREMSGASELAIVMAGQRGARRPSLRDGLRV